MIGAEYTICWEARMAKTQLMSKILLMGLALISVPASASAQSLDVSEGRHIAQSVCSKCHDVGPVPSATETRPAPAFVTISRMPSMTPLAVRVFLRSSHRHMPNILLTAKEIDAVADYIASLPEK